MWTKCGDINYLSLHNIVTWEIIRNIKTGKEPTSIKYPFYGCCCFLLLIIIIHICRVGAGYHCNPFAIFSFLCLQNSMVSVTHPTNNYS